MEEYFLGKTVVVTGATSGIGLATAKALVRRGASVIGVGRSLERCQSAENLLRSINSQANVTYLVADLSLQSQVRSLAARIGDRLAARGIAGLDGLVNNAGTFTYWLALTPEGFEVQWAVNHLAPFLITLELLPLLRAAPMGRIVTVSSDSHFGTRLNWEDIQLRRHYNGLRAYSQTKLANVLFTLQLNQFLGDQSSVRAFAADPGLVKTEIGYKGTPALVRKIWEVRRAGGVDPQEPAQGILFLLEEPSIQASAEVYWKSGAPKAASHQACDLEAARRLWEMSERMCGIEWEAGHVGEE